MQTKQKKWWQRSMSVMLSMALVASSVSLTGLPEKAKAADSTEQAAPGGVKEGLISWINIEKSAVISDGMQITELTDLVDKGAWTTSTPNINVPNALNFNAGIEITPSKGYYIRSAADYNDDSNNLQAREIFSVQRSNNYVGFPWEWGGTYTNKSEYGSNNRILTYFGRTNALAIDTSKYDLENATVLNIWSAVDSWALNLNGNNLREESSNTPNFTSPVNGTYYFGAGHMSRFNGMITESIVYNRKLTVGERKKVNSYLALKYGSTLSEDYVASNGSTFMWTVKQNEGYGNRITGIGRDDNGALNQKQSKSQEKDANITIALGNEVEASNADNSNEFSNDLSFFTFSDNGKSTDLIVDEDVLINEEHLKRTNRIYKVQKTNFADTNITLEVDPMENTTELPLYLIVSSDDQFTAEDQAYPIKNGKVTINSDRLEDGAYFTVATTPPTIQGTQLEQTEDNKNQIVLEFDKELNSTIDWNGFTVNIDGQPLSTSEMTIEVDASNNNKLILTLPDGTDLVGKSIQVVYDGNGSLEGKNTAPVNPFTNYIVNKLQLKNTITEANTKNEVDYTPKSWQVMQEKLVAAQAVLDDANATQEQVDQAYEELKLAIDGLVTVDKKALNEKVKEGNAKNEQDYTPESWQAMQEKLAAAQDVLNDENATQEEVKQAYVELEQAINDLVPVMVDKTALTEKVAEANTKNEEDYTPESWQAMQGKLAAAQAVLDDKSATQEQVDQAYAELEQAIAGLVPVSTTVPVTTPDFSSLTPSTGTLSPSFSSDVTNYTMNVGYATSQLSFTAVPLNPNASVTMTVNGQVVNVSDSFPLLVGENTVMITVVDSTGSKTYAITINRAKKTSSGSSSGGGNDKPSTTDSDTTTTIEVELEIDGNNPLEKTTVEIERTKHDNGEITDFVALTEENAKEAVEKAKQIGNNIARIVIPDVNDEVDEVKVEIPKQSVQTLRDNGLSLEISTDNAHIAIPLSSMEGVNDTFYFRLVPVKNETERKAIEERARVEQVVRETLQSNDVNVVARPMTIETNMPSRPVQVTLPLKGVDLPTEKAELEEFLAKLAVFIEHSDGEKTVVFPEVVTMANGELGLRFTVDKFSTFSVIQFENQATGEHVAYIKGFEDGTFGPQEYVTRAQMARMIARVLGYKDGQTVDYAPFNDIPSDHYAAGAIAFVKERGIMNGDENGNFHAGEYITRAQMAAVVANYKHLQIDENVPLTFNDTKGHWAQWIIEANREAGIIIGREDGSFGPKENLTRAHAVKMLNRMFERGPLNGVTTPSFSDVNESHWAFKEIEEAARSHSYILDEDGNEYLYNKE